MNERRSSSQSLPHELEEQVLTILEGDEAHRDDALRQLLRAQPTHATAIRRWLDAAGVDVPITVAAGETTAASTDVDLDTPLPHKLGAYVLLERLGRGGFGTVYRGEQQEPIKRPVAVKILNPGMDSREVLARFTAEREALNRMDHPGIARLLDAGSTTKGRPFFVMELVVGPTLLTWCRKHRLPVRERLRLFLLVLDAMQHAHQKAMLHRDLSSNNVLVAAELDGHPQPKIIDFGIAKSLADPLLQGGAMTMRGTLMGTPEFMSPEQADGRTDDIDTRADVYALGVQLYELVSDQLPIPGVTLRSQGIAGMAEVVRTFQPPRPSEVAPAERRRELRGDLDSIVMKAIAKAREDRYGSVGELAADLRAFLADEPIAVSRPSRWLRFRKFVRRNRAQSVVVAIAAIALLVGVWLMWSALRMAETTAAAAEQQRRLSEKKANAGFLLLATDERLAEAIAAERALPPPWPEHRAAYEAWLRDHGEPLERERATLREPLTLLEQQVREQGHRRDESEMRHLARALDRLDGAFQRFRDDGGELREVQRRLRLLGDVIAPQMIAHEAAWKAAIAAIAACKEYRGLRVGVLGGLVPLGSNPNTGLHEFLDLASHAPGYPVPERDAATGRLRADAGTGVVFVLVPGGRLEQGANRNQPGVDRNDDLAEDDELLGGPIALDAFLIARTELTQAQWGRLTGARTMKDDPQMPATGMDWYTARIVLERFGMALPTEAQWEYACRAGSRFAWSTGAALDEVTAAGWFEQGLQPVALLAPNAFGLFDVHGNVAEWCEDEKLSYQDTAPRRVDGLRERARRAGEDLRVVRGGAWHEGPAHARTTARDARPPSSRDAAIGVRPVRSLKSP